MINSKWLYRWLPVGSKRKSRVSKRNTLAGGWERLEDRVLLAGMVTQLGYFETWDGGVIPSTDPAGITFHAPSGNLYIADSEINELPEYFDGNNIFEVSTSGDTLVQSITSYNDEPTGIAFNEFDGFFYVTNDVGPRLVTRYDSNLNNPLYQFAPKNDVSSALDPEGITIDPTTGNLYIIDGADGGRQVLVYSLDLSNPNPATRDVNFEYSFSVTNQQDGEGIAFNPENNHLYIVSDPDNMVFEYALNGTLIEEYDISGLTPKPRSPQGLTFAPTSDSFDDPSALALYIADGGYDNYPDGGVFEVLVSNGQPNQNSAPVVSAGPDLILDTTIFPRDVALDGTVVDDGLPAVPGMVTTSWSVVSGPASVTFADPSAVDTVATFSMPGTYVLRLTANDGSLISNDETTVEFKNEVNVAIVTSSDDAEERTATGKTIIDSGDLDMAVDSGSSSNYTQLIGLRFGGISIPFGATITNAFLQFTADETTSVATNLVIEAQAIDNAPTFNTSNGNISSRSRTTASVTWNPASWVRKDSGLDQQTPNIASVIQEIVNRLGWVSGNALAFIIRGTGERVAESFDGKASAAPNLHIEYSLDNNNQPPTGSVTISGISSEDQVLTASNTLADDDGLGTISYQWRRNAINIAGATASTYLLNQADVGAIISVVASYTDGAGHYTSVPSSDVGPIANVNDPPTGMVTINGMPDEYQTLTVTDSLADEDGMGTVAYQWQRNAVNIPGATSNSYQLTQADVGTMISVVASYIDNQGTNESVVSSSVGPIANVDIPPTILYFSLTSAATLPGGLMVENEDVVAFDGQNFSLFFDGSDVGLSSTNIDGMKVINENEILFSFSSTENIPDIVGAVDDSDIVKFTATQLGSTTAGTFSLFFRGSDVGLSTSSDDVQAIDLLDDGRLIVSTKGGFSVPGVSGANEDLIAFTPTTPGNYFSGTWSMYFDGSDVELAPENVYAAAIGPSGEIYLSTSSSFAVTGLAGEGEDVFVFVPSQLGENTSGSYSSTLFFDGSEFGLAAEYINAIDIPHPAALNRTASARTASTSGSSASGGSEFALPSNSTLTIPATSILGWNAYQSVSSTIPIDSRVTSTTDTEETIAKPMNATKSPFLPIKNDIQAPHNNQRNFSQNAERINYRKTALLDQFFTESFDLLQMDFFEMLN